MGMEVVGADATTGQVNVVDDGSLFQEKESKATAKEREEAAVFGLDSIKDGVNGVAKEGDKAAPKDAVEEWPDQKIHAFYFVRFRSYDDPKLKAKIEQVDKDAHRKNQVRFQITEALRAKRAKRANIIEELKPLTAENKKYNEAVNEKMKEMEPLQDRLGKFRNENNAMRAKSMGLCSSEEELDNLIASLEHRMTHESISLDEEKRLLKEIKQLKATRSKVVANAADRVKYRDSAVEREAMQDQVKQIGVGIDEVRKERQAVRAKIKILEEDLKAIDADISSLQEELASAIAKKDKAFETLNELRRSRDLANVCVAQNRRLFNEVKELVVRSEVRALQELAHDEAEKFMALWNSRKDFREDYEKRILTSLNVRRLCRDGRMRNPDERPIILETQLPTEPEPAPAKVSAKQAKEVVSAAPRVDPAPKDEARGKATAKGAEDSKAKAAYLEDVAKSYDSEKPPKEVSKSKEIDAAKLKELRREEEMTKNKLALERKKKLAEKQAAKAAARAQKEAEKKLKEKEKKAKKKTAASIPSELEDQAETDTKTDEAEESDAKEEAPALVKAKEQKETVRYRGSSKSQNQLPKVILKRKKSQAYWSSAAPVAAVAAVLAIMLAVFGYYHYYIPASN